MKKFDILNKTLNKLIVLILFLLSSIINSNAQTNVYLTVSGGSLGTEKWVSITTGANGTGTQVWGQGTGVYSNGAGYLTDYSIDLTGYEGQTLYLNCYDKYDDTWEGTVYLLEETASGPTIINNGGASPTDGADTDASSGWDGTSSSSHGNELETSESFTVPCAAPSTQASSLSFSSVLSTSFDVNWSRGDGDGGVIVVAKAGSAATDPTSGTSYTANSIYGTGGTECGGGYVVYKGTGTSVSVTGLTASTTYHFNIYEFNTTDDCYNMTELTGSQATTACDGPTTQATSVTFSNHASTSTTLSWTRGNGDGGVIVVAKSGSAATDPTVATTYTANAAYGTGGTECGGGYVVYNGTGTSVNITGLSNNTTYYYNIYEYNSSGTCYNLTELATSEKAGWCNPSPSSVDGSGITRVVIKTIDNSTGSEANNYGDYSAQSTDVDLSETVNVDITFSTGFTYVTKIWVDWNNDGDFADTGEEEYSGTSTSSNPTTLNASISVPADAAIGNHRLRIGGADTGPPTECYTGTYASYEDYTINVLPACTYPTTQASAAGTASVSTTSMTVSWTRGDGDGVILIGQAGGAVDEAPSDDNDYSGSANLAWGSAGNVTTDNKILYVGTGTSAAITGLAELTDYHFAVYEYTASGNCYKTSPATTNATTLCTAPTTDASAASVTDYEYNTTDLAWTGGDGSGVIVVAKAGTVDWTPTDGVDYSGGANAAFGTGTQYGTGNYIVYAGNLDAVSVTNLTASTAYDYDIYEYSASYCYGTVHSIQQTTRSDAMRVSSITVSQASTSDMLLGATDQEVLKITLVITGASSSVTLNSIAVTSTSTNDATDITSLELFKHTSDAYGSATQLATAQALSSGVATFSSISESYSSSGTYYIWVTANIESTATEGNFVDFKLAANSIDISSTTYPSSEENPSGNRLINHNKGLQIAGGIINNGTIDQTNDSKYLTVTGAGKTMTGTGTYTNAKLKVSGSYSQSTDDFAGEINKLLVIDGGSYTVDASRTFDVADVTLTGTGILDITSGSMEVSGNWTNSSSAFTSTSSTVTFDGASTQTITSGGDAFNNVTFNNTDATGVSLSGQMVINGTATFTDGFINTSSSNELYLGTASSISGGSTASYVDGPLIKASSTTAEFTMPLGDNGSYKWVKLTPSAGGSTTEWTGRYYNSPHGDNDIAAGSTANIDHVSNLEYWDISPSGANTSAHIEISWDASSGVDDYTTIVICHYNGTAWEFVPGNAPTGNNTAGSVKSTDPWGTWSPVEPGSSGASNPLSVEIVDIQAICNDGNNELTWTTASETNSDYFSVEKSSNAIEFDQYATVTAAGNSVNYEYYSIYDLTPFDLTYYRLKQFDYNGDFEYSKIVVADCGAESQESEFTIIDVISKEALAKGYFTILFNSPNENLYRTLLYNVNGQLLAWGRVTAEAGFNYYEMSVENIAPGVYMLVMYSNDGKVSKKIVIN